MMNDNATPAVRNVRVDLPGYLMDAESVAYRQGLVDRLNVYENRYIEYLGGFFVRSRLSPEMSLRMAHTHALSAAGLLEDGLRMARIYAGKRNTSEPGIV